MILHGLNVFSWFVTDLFGLRVSEKPCVHRDVMLSSQIIVKHSLLSYSCIVIHRSFMANILR